MIVNEPQRVAEPVPAQVLGTGHTQPIFQPNYERAA